MKLTPAKIAVYQRLEETISARLRDILKKYCAGMGIHYAYGIESWEVDGVLEIVQDTTSRGCHDFQRYTFPLEVLYSDEALNAYMEAQKTAQAEAKKADEDRILRNKRAQLALLKKELGDQA
jgi:hypothetical protein